MITRLKDTISNAGFQPVSEATPERKTTPLRNEPTMRRPSTTQWILLLSLWTTFLSLPSAAQIDPSKEPVPSLSDAVDTEARSFVVEMQFHGQNEVTLTSVDVIDAIPPSRLGGSGAYRVEILNGEGSRIEAFDWWDPQEVQHDDGNGRHSTSLQPVATGKMIFPFSPRATELRLKDPSLGFSVLIVDLETPAHHYCRNRPWEPRCRELIPPSEDPNLVVSLFARAAVPSRETMELEVRVTNLGGGEAFGTLQDPDGYMVDLVLSTDQRLPEEWAVFEPVFVEDVLLEGGRISNTETLPGGESITYTTEVRLPEHTEPGTYCLGAHVDPGHAVQESVELDNTFCFQLTVEP